MHHFLRGVFACLFALLAMAQTPAAETVKSVTSNFSNDQLSVEIISDQNSVIAGESLRVGIRFKMKPDWHVYYKEPGEVGVPTRIQFSSLSKLRFGELLWKKPTRFDGDDVSFGYAGETLIASVLNAPSSLTDDSGFVTIKANISWLACNTSCIPGKTELELTLPLAAKGAVKVLQNAELFKGLGFDGDVYELSKPSNSVFDKLNLPQGAANQTIWQVLFFAFIGGLILNVMPCVLPVVSIKLMHFVRESGEDRRKLVGLTLAYTAGTISTCVLLGLAVVLAQYAGASVGWGFQFQQPWFLIGMASLLTVMSLSMLGMFFIQVSTGGKLDELSRKSGLAGSFFTGVVATILSTPCTAPYLGSAIGFAFSQSWFVTLAVFAVIGLGLAAPYLVLGFNPSWKRFIPKPGVWMEHFKQAMGFLLLASVIWLLFVLGRMIGSDGVVGTMALLLAVAFATWLINTFAHGDANRKQKLMVWAIAAVLVALPGWLLVAPAISVQKQLSEVSAPNNGAHSKINWQDFSQETVERLLNEKRIVFIDFTAQWCQTCKLNEFGVLSNDSLVNEFNRLNVAAVKADWTFSNPVITEVLKKFGRSGVPFYVIFDPRRPETPILLSELLTVNEVLEALRRASEN